MRAPVCGLLGVAPPGLAWDHVESGPDVWPRAGSRPRTEGPALWVYGRAGWRGRGKRGGRLGARDIEHFGTHDEIEMGSFLQKKWLGILMCTVNLQKKY